VDFELVLEQSGTGHEPAAIIHGRGRGIQGSGEHRGRVDRAAAAFAAGGLALVIYLVAALLGGDGNRPTPRSGGDPVTASSSPAAERPRPALRPRRGRGSNTLSGTVIDAAGAPVAGVSVSAQPEDPAAPAEVVVAVTAGDG